MDNQKYLFTLTITPVQSFISQARKTRDLYAGSEILSSVIRDTIERAENNYQVKKIFPQDTDFVSNKFVFELKNTDPKELGKDLEEFINNRVMNLIFQNTNCSDNSLNNFFQVFWVAVKLDESNYKESYKKLEQSLGAVKNLRIFTQQTQLKGIKKCSLCGERNIINKDDKDTDKKELCLVCYTKRCYIENSDNYPSTAKIALLDWLKDINYEDLKKKKDFDEQWFLENDKKEIKEFIESKGLKVKEQKKYYALIHFDIDDMGKKLSGLEKDKQMELSNVLAKFSKKAKSIVDRSGKTIYAGGDDFLGFVNLEYLFIVMKCIQRAFKQIVKKEFPDLTYSLSIIIAHYKAPLHKVLDYSRELLATTKSHFGDDKNGVGMIVMSNSAINAQTICKYDDLALLNKMREKKIGMNLHYKLKTIFSFIDDKTITYTEYKYQIGMLKYEIKRLLKREQGNFDKELYFKLVKFLHKQVDGLDTETKITINFDNFIGYLKTLEQFKKVM